MICLVQLSDSFFVFQDKVVKTIENKLLKKISNLCDWFVDNKAYHSFWRG